MTGPNGETWLICPLNGEGNVSSPGPNSKITPVAVSDGQGGEGE